MRSQVERYGDARSVLLYAEIRAVISLKWSVIRPYYVTIRWSCTVTFWHTAVGNRIVTVHGRITVYFNDSTARISAYNNTDRMRTRIRSVLFVLGSHPFITKKEKKKAFFVPHGWRPWPSRSKEKTVIGDPASTPMVYLSALRASRSRISSGRVGLALVEFDRRCPVVQDLKVKFK